MCAQVLLCIIQVYEDTTPVIFKLVMCKIVHKSTEYCIGKILAT